MPEKQKAKRVIKELDFKGDNAAVALVSKDQGGAANGYSTLMLKGEGQYSKEFIEKMQQVQVTMELPDFLRKFFDMWYEDAEILARLMGYVPPEKESYDYEKEYEDYMQEKLDSFVIMKSLKESESFAKSFSELTEEQLLSLLTDQMQIEKAMKEAESAKGAKADADTSTKNLQVENGGVNAPVSKSKSKEKPMSKKDEGQPEMIEKAQFESIQKAFEDQKVELEKAKADLDGMKVELQKAQDAIAAMEAEKKEALAKAKEQKILDVVKNAEKAQPLIKAALSLESEDDFTAFMSAIQAMMTTVETSEMFVEKGATSTEEVELQVDPVAKVLKAKYADKK